MTRPVYLDHAASTPIDPGVRAAMNKCMDDGVFANASSIHIEGRRSAALVQAARQQVAELLHTSPGRIVWTSGATESDNLAITGAARFRADRGKHIVTMPTEHKAVADTFRALEKDGFEVSWLEPDVSGRIDHAVLRSALREDTQLVSIMHVNNETGVVQDLAAIGEICRERDVLFHTDAAQAVGKLDIDLSQLPIDLLSLTGHKFHGPQGIGALYIADRPGCHVHPLLFGGGQEQRLRPGTIPVHLVVGIGEAARLAVARRDEDARHLLRLRQRLWEGISVLPDLYVNGDQDFCCPSILNVSAAGVEGESLMLAMEPVCVSSGSACNSQSGESSYVLRALGRDDHLAQSAVRFSFGRSTTDKEIDFAVEQYTRAVNRLRNMASGIGA